MPQFVPSGTFSFLPHWLRTLSESQYDKPIQWYTCSHKSLAQMKPWVLAPWVAADRQPDSSPLWASLRASTLFSFPGFMWLSMAPAASQGRQRCLSLHGSAQAGDGGCAVLQSGCSPPLSLTGFALIVIRFPLELFCSLVFWFSLFLVIY